MSRNRLWSLAAVLTLHAKNFAMLMHAVVAAEHLLEKVPANGSIDALDKATADDLRKKMAWVEEQIIDRCNQIELRVSARVAEDLSKFADIKSLRERFVSVRTSVLAELEGRAFYAPSPEFTRYFQQDQLFGSEVFNAFPSANEDIAEAGTCLALERPTACVMHLMRVAEVGLTALAASLGFTNQNDWGAYITKIEKELESRYKNAGSRSADEQFFAEAAANFDRIRRAWRNPTMHVAKTYTQERAEEILLAVKAFMAHLATKLKETP